MKITTVEYNVATGEEIVKEIELTEEEVAQQEQQAKVSQINQRMQEIVQELNSTDWKTVKYMELGQFDEEYEEHIAHRQALRDEYNALEAQL